MTEKLTNKDTRLIVVGLVVAVLWGATMVWLNPIANPEAEIDFKLTREESGEQAELFLRNSEWDVTGFTHADRFDYDEDVKEYLERHVPRAQADDIFGVLNGYRWRHRWFQRGDLRQYRVELSTGGELAAFQRVLPEDATGDSIAQPVARDVAEFFLAGQVGWRPQEWRLVEARSERLANRVDHHFEWEAQDELAGAVERVSVVIQGDEVGRYNRWLELPEAWVRAQRAQRFQDVDSPFVVAIVLAVIAILFTVLGARPGQIRWRASAAFGAVLAFLIALNELNSYGTNQFTASGNQSGLETLFQFVVGDLLLGAGVIGVVFWLLMGGAEVGYRAMFPRHIALRNMLSVDGIKTRSFMRAITAGAALALFVAAFTVLAQFFEGSLQGWRESRVPDVNNLSTTLPWVDVLMGAFLTTVFLEAVFRMFVVPFAMRRMSLIGAVLLSAVMWGGLGLGEADLKWFHVLVAFVTGLVTALVFVRFGILATLYGSFAAAMLAKSYELLRAGDPFLVTTGAVGVGLLLLPILYAVVSYLRNGGFHAETGLTNADDTDPPAPVQEKTKERYYDPSTYVEPSPMLRRVAIALFAVGVIAFAVTWPRTERSVRVEVDRNAAVGFARSYLNDLGADIDGYLDAAVTSQRLGAREADLRIADDRVVRYIVEAAGPEAVGAVYRDVLSPCRWRVRFAMPLEQREYNVFVDARTGRIAGHRFIVPDSSAGMSLQAAEAETLARSFLADRGVASVSLTLLDSRTIERPARRDHVMSFKAVAPLDIGDAEVVYEISVAGDGVRRFEKDLRVPASWAVEAAQSSSADDVKTFTLVIGATLLIVLWLVTLARALRQSRPKWTPAIVGAALFAIVKTASEFNQWPQQAMSYVTDVSIATYIQNQVQNGLPGVLISAALIVVIFLTLTTLCSGALSALAGRARGTYARGALFAIVATAGVALLELALRSLTKLVVPAAYPMLGLKHPEIDTTFPGFDLVTSTVMGTTIVAVLLMIAVFFYRRHVASRPVAMRWAFFVLMALVTVQPDSLMRVGGPAEALVSMAMMLGVIALILKYWRWNPLAFVAGTAVLILVEAVPVAISQPAYGTQLAVAFAILLVPLLAIALQARRGRTGQ